MECSRHNEHNEYNEYNEYNGQVISRSKPLALIEASDSTIAVRAGPSAHAAGLAHAAQGMHEWCPVLGAVNVLPGHRLKFGHKVKVPVAGSKIALASVYYR